MMWEFGIDQTNSYRVINKFFCVKILWSYINNIVSHLHKSADGQAIYQNEVYTDIDGEHSGEHIINVFMFMY